MLDTFEERDIYRIDDIEIATAYLKTKHELPAILKEIQNREFMCKIHPKNDKCITSFYENNEDILIYLSVIKKEIQKFLNKECKDN